MCFQVFLANTNIFLNGSVWSIEPESDSKEALVQKTGISKTGTLPLDTV